MIGQKRPGGWIAREGEGALGGGLADTNVPSPAGVSAAGVARYTFIDLITTGLPLSGDRWAGVLRRAQ